MTMSEINDANLTDSLGYCIHPQLKWPKFGAAMVSEEPPMTSTTWTAPMRPRDLPRRRVEIREYVFQPKWDGWYVVFQGGHVYTRHGEDITGWACWAGRELPDNAVGELLHRDGRHRIPSLATSADGLRVVLFDVPGDEPLEVRLAMLPEIAARYGFDAVESFGVETWEQANDAMAEAQTVPNVEGLVLKRRGSAWVAGESHRDWFRMKRAV